MLSFSPDSEMIKKLKDFQGLLAEVNKNLEQLSRDEGQYLNKFALISNIGASTRIENAVLTDQEIEWVDTVLAEDGKPTAYYQMKHTILDKLSKDKERSVEEVIGCRKILSTIYMQSRELFPLTEVCIRGLHHDLLRYYPEAKSYAGGYKESPNRVISINHETGEEQIVLDPAPPGIITSTAMSDLVAWYNKAIKNYSWPLLVAVEFVFRFLAIHPFTDGNGRMGRALFILALLQSGDRYWENIVPFIAIDRHIEQNRTQYYAVLNQGSNGKYQAESANYNFEPILWFFLKIIESSLKDIEIYRNKYENLQKLSESALKVLDCFKTSPEKRLKVSLIEKEIGLPRRTIQYALKTLVQKEFIQLLGQGADARYQLVF